MKKNSVINSLLIIIIMINFVGICLLPVSEIMELSTMWSINIKTFDAHRSCVEELQLQILCFPTACLSMCRTALVFQKPLWDTVPLLQNCQCRNVFWIPYSFKTVHLTVEKTLHFIYSYGKIEYFGLCLLATGHVFCVWIHPLQSLIWDPSTLAPIKFLRILKQHYVVRISSTHSHSPQSCDNHKCLQ